MVLNLMNNIIAICGDSGSGKTTLAKELSLKIKNSMIFECDRYHKWERNNWNWKYYTHLNPSANNIDIMIEDLEKLKNNESISQIKYDHSSGNFTENQIITPCKNIFVCGLHSFYIKSDINIYIDVEENLKYVWKINRDFKNRGYTIEEILKNIERRKSEYNNYVYPEINKSDILISYSWEKKLKKNIKIINDSKIKTEIGKKIYEVLQSY